MKICVLSFECPPGSWSKSSTPNKKRYCDFHGYDFVHISKNSTKRPPAWNKILCIQKALNEYDCDWLFWLDADTYILDGEKKIESYLSDKDLIVCQDPCGINTGAMLIKNSKWSSWLFSESWNYEKYGNDEAGSTDVKCTGPQDSWTGTGWEQTNIQSIIGQWGEKFPEHVDVISFSDNSTSFNVAGKDICDSTYIAHFRAGHRNIPHIENYLTNKYPIFNSKPSSSPQTTTHLCKHPSLNKISRAIYINLDRRPDRKRHIEENLPFHAERFSAIDSKTLKLDDNINAFFSGFLNKLTKSEISCALSHYKLWKRLTLDKGADNYLILEDDVVFKDGFVDFWNQVFSKHIPKNYNLIYLGGCQPWNKPQYHKVLKKYNDYFNNVKKNDFFTKDDHYFHMNAQSYLISKNGASLICQYIDQLGFNLGKDEALDIFMINFFNKNKLFKDPASIYHLHPLMSYQLHEENDNVAIDKNSDIRNDTEKFKPPPVTSAFPTDISLSNPSRIFHKSLSYTLFRGEKYSTMGGPPPGGLNRSVFSYWLEVGDSQGNTSTTQCEFIFPSYSYKEIRRIDLDDGKCLIEDIRFIENTFTSDENGLRCLATCSLIPGVTFFNFKKDSFGNVDKSSPLGLTISFNSAVCEVDLVSGGIKFLYVIDPNNQRGTLQKNWMCLRHRDLYYVLYSMSPLIYSCSDSLDNISFGRDFSSPSIDFHNATNPIKLSGNTFLMLCNKSLGGWCNYNTFALTFEALNGDIKILSEKQIFPPQNNTYCSSIRKCGDKIEVLGGVNNTDHVSFFIDLSSVSSLNLFSPIRLIENKGIQKKIHLCWKNKNVLDSNYSLIKKGAKNLELLNPDWDIEVNDDEDVNRYIRDNIGKSSWKLIKDKKITEKTDLWRLLKIYKEGGLYIDIDRYIDTPLSEIVNEKTSCVIPTFNDIDFSQDFILSCANNPMIESAISNNLFNRKNGQNLFYTAVCSYMHAVSEFLSGKQVDRGDNPYYFNNIRKQIHACEYLETYRELGPENHILFRDINKQFNSKIFEEEKADFYNSESVIHWNQDNVNFNKQYAANKNLKDKSGQLKQGKMNVVWQGISSEFYEKDWLVELFDLANCNHIEDLNFNVFLDNSIVIYSDMFSASHSRYPKSLLEKWTLHNTKIKNYFKNFEGLKNCYLIHLTDEYCHAYISHYKYFDHVFRNYYREDAHLSNVTFFPLGYKNDFKI